MESGYLIRNALLSDYSEIAKLDKLLNDEHKKRRADIIRQDIPLISYEQFRTVLLSSSTKMSVAEINNEIIGFVLAKQCNYHKHATIIDMPVIEIEKLFVNPMRRHNKVGTALFNEIISFAQVQHIDKIELTVWGWNNGAIEFYHKMGLYNRYHRLEFDV